MQPLSSQQVDEFFDRGFIVIRRLFSPDEVRQVAEAFDQLRAIAQDFEGNVEHNGSLFKVKRLTREDGSQHRQIHLIAWCGATCPTLLQFGAEAHLHIPDIVFSRSISDPNRDHPRWDQTRICDTAWRWIMDGRIDGRLIVTPVVPFEDAREEYARVISDSEAGIKLGIRH